MKKMNKAINHDLQSQLNFFTEIINNLSQNCNIIKTESNIWEYWVTGEGQNTIILFHGGFNGPEMWFYLVNALENSYRIIVPQIPKKISGVSDIVEFFNILLEKENLQNLIILGYSYGGGIAQILIDQVPNNINCVILSHTGIMWGRKPKSMRKLKFLINIIPSSTFRKIFLKKRIQNFPDSKWNDFHKFYFTQLINKLEKRDFIDFLNNSQIVLKDLNSLKSNLDNFHGKVILLGTKGDDDTFHAMSLLHEKFPNSLEYVFTGFGGHHFMFLNPEIYTSKLLDLLDQIE